jgi:hypothetical protein
MKNKIVLKFEYIGYKTTIKLWEVVAQVAASTT